MKIVCTAEEKEQLIITMSCGTQCPFAQTDSVVCDGLMQCKPCVEKNVDWEITNDEKLVEMYVTHNDGTTEYISDIDSIGLLARKDYGITYYGEIVRH